MTNPLNKHIESKPTSPCSNPVQEGEEPFRVLHRRYADRVMGYALRLTGGRRADAEDLVQDTFVAAYRSRTGFQKRSGFLTWLLGIATRRWRDTTRQGAIRTVSMHTHTESPDDLPDERRPFEERVTDAAVLEAALAQLPDRERAALLLVVSQQLTYAEAARASGEPEGTVKWRVHRAVKEMNRLLVPTFDKNVDAPINENAHAEPIKKEHTAAHPASVAS